MLSRRDRPYVWLCAMGHAEELVKLIDWIEFIQSMDDVSPFL